jgi:uncharacterized protein (TIGR02646 family)
MIRIQKPAIPPRVLTTRGARETAKLCADYLRHRDDYRSGARPFAFDAAIYAHPTVKDALKTAQHGKCAFCESRITHVQHGDVEHFRPKKGVLRGGLLLRPGYYWLAYDWDNLLLSCQICNQRHKRNTFPLQKGSRRARSHLGSIAKEKPVFIHPAQEDPTLDIAFREHVPYARNGSSRGRRTIAGLGLSRRELMEERERHLGTIKRLQEAALKLQPGSLRDEILAHLRRATEDHEPFAAMVRAFLASTPPSP